MKKLLLFLLVITSIVGNSQISLDFQSSSVFMNVFKLTDSETKYIDYPGIPNQNQFSLYNLDGSLYKTIIMPAKPDTSALIYWKWFISKSLFDNDSSTIEYIVEYIYDSIPGANYHHVQIIREDGTILLNELYADSPNIYSTEDGTKLMLNYVYANGYYYQTKVFNLPGKLPNMVKEEMGAINNNLILYPNPNNGSFYIKFLGKAGEKNTIDLYNGIGKHIDTFKSDNNLIHVNKYGLPDGVYFLNNRVSVLRSTTKMIIEK